MIAMQILCRSVAGNTLASEENSAVAKIAGICEFDTKQWQGGGPETGKMMQVRNILITLRMK